MGGGKQKDVTMDNGDYVKGKEAGITVAITPKHYSTGPRNVKFSILCRFKTKILLKDDKNENEAVDAELPYILDFDLGPPKTPSVVAQPIPSLPNISEKEEVKDKPAHKTRKSNENIPTSTG